MNDLFNHLWQSTAFAAVIAIVCFTLRSNHPRVRYWLWLSASLKFLIPFSILVSLGHRLFLPADNPRLTAITVERISMSFAPAQTFAAPTGVIPERSQWPLMIGIIWAIGAAFVAGRWLRQWFRLSISMRSGKSVSLNLPIPVVLTPSSVEPGVFGVFRPVLLLPEGLTTRLTPGQLRGIIAHELCHVRERDNLLAMMHMFVETLFWFHPLVWWIGARLIEERERACDESVIAQGNSADDYAAGILGVCKFYLESPLSCMAGITGSDLKRRIREIMTYSTSSPMTMTRKLAVALTGLAVIAIPIAVGVLRAQTLPPAPLYKFEVASIRPSNSATNDNRLGPSPEGGLKGENVTILQLIAFAYDLRPFQIAEIPGWVQSQRFHIQAIPDQPEKPLAPNAPMDAMTPMLNKVRQRTQSLLTERFGLVLRVGKKEMQVYALLPAKDGPKLRHSAEGTPLHMQSNPVSINAKATDMTAFVRTLSGILRRPVVDQTALAGLYDLSMEWSTDLPNGETIGSGPSIATAIQEQLGLKLESKRAPVSVFVIEKIEKPSEN